MRGKLLISLALASLVFSACSVADTGLAGSDQAVKKMGVPSGYNLVWSDEFNTDGQPSTANWNYHVGNGYNPNLPGFQGWGNGEWEWYRPENCYQSGGNLVIKGEYSSTPYYTVNGTSFYQKSGRITTRGKKNFQYGYIEARIKNPTLQGNWTAFWMMGASGTGDSYTASYNPAASYYDTTLNNWASCGEIDIMEHCAGSTTGNNYCFWDTRTGIYAWTYGMNGDYGTTSANYGDPTAYHTYAILWDASSITWYVDGNQTWRIDTTPATLEEFRKPFYFILNMAIGGSLAGNVSTTGWPIYMYVDYVRVYQYGGTPVSSSSSSVSSSSSSSSSSTTVVSAGTYNIRNRASGLMLDNLGSTANGANVAQWSAGTSPNQKYVLTYVNGYAKLMCLTGNQYLDSVGRSGNGSQVGQWGSSTSPNQDWTIQSVGGGYYKIINRANGLALDTGGGTANGSVMQFWGSGSSYNQQWQFISTTGSSSSSSTPTSGTWQYGVEGTGTTTIYFTPSWTAGWVDVHYIYNNGAQQNIRMTYNSSKKRWEQKVTGTAKGKVIKYFFTYEKSGLAYDTPWYTKTL